MKKRVLIVTGVIIGILIGCKYLLDVQNYKNEIAAIRIEQQI